MFRVRLADKAALLKAFMVAVASPLTPRRPTSTRGRQMVEPLEHRILMASTPFGGIETFTNTTIAGYAYNKDTGPAAVTVRFIVDGQVTDVVADDASPTHDALLGSPNHGFTFAMPELAPGAHKVTVGIVNPSNQRLVILRNATVTNAIPKGAVTTLDATTISGYAFDLDSGTGPIQIEIYNNGQLLGTATANETLAKGTPGKVGDPNHGFTFTVPGGTTLGVVDVMALDNPTDTKVLLKTTNLLAKGKVSITRQNVSGYTYDPDNPDDTLQVEVRLDGVLLTTLAADQPVANIPGLTGSLNHGFSYDLAPIPVGKHTITVYALDSKTASGSKVLIGKATVTNPPPAGKITTASETTVTGTANDPDAKGNPLDLEVRVDGNVVATGQTTGSSYSISYAALSGDPHKIEVFATDVDTGAKIKVGEKIINNLLPVGAIQIASPTTLSGYALDPNDPNTQVDVIILVDGAQYPAVTANATNNNVPPGVGSNHGFSAVMPTVFPGKHTVQAIVVDTFTGLRTVVAKKTFTNKAPVGKVEVINATTISGYTYDPDSPQQSINVLLQIKSASTGALITQTQGPANQAHAKLPTAAGPNHGFTIAIPPGTLPAGKYAYLVYGIDPATGVTKLLGAKVITIL